MVTVTENAVRKIKSFIESDPSIQGKSLRLGLRSGGCSGFEYAFTFDQKQDGDFELALDGFSLLVDSESLKNLQGSTVDYFEDVSGAGFKIKNPNVKHSCGCGKSNQF